MNVLCVAAHPDDEILGVGGTLARHVAEGDDVRVCFLADGVGARHEREDDEVQEEIDQRRGRARKACDRIDVESTSFYSFPDNRLDTVPLLDLVKTIEDEIREHDPGVVYTHHYGDLNVDHEVACRATMTAARPLKDVEIHRILAFETLSATEWSVPAPNNAFQPQHFVNVANQLDTKLDALAVYEDELRDAPHPRTVDTVRRNARVWGAKAGIPAAEAFQLLREVKR